MEPGSSSTAPPSKKRWRKWLVAVGCTIFALGVAGEMVARYVLGLGDPPLSVADPQIEYMFVPSRAFHRFGNTISFNAYSMRSDVFPARKSSPDEVRVLVIGDSVVNGGAQTDQAQLATSLLQKSLREELKKPVFVGNASAGSWGPPNELAYVKRFGFFDADVVVAVESSHDADDMPTFAPIVGVDPSFPDHSPVLALQEAFTRYLLPRLFGHGEAPTAAVPQAVTGSSTQPAVRAIGAFDELIGTASASGAKVIVLLHRTRAESVTGQFDPGHAELAAAATARGISPVDLGPVFAESIHKGIEPYRDEIHPNAVGQELIYRTMLPLVRGAIGPKGAVTQP